MSQLVQGSNSEKIKTMIANGKIVGDISKEVGLGTTKNIETYDLYLCDNRFCFLNSIESGYDFGAEALIHYILNYDVTVATTHENINALKIQKPSTTSGDKIFAIRFFNHDGNDILEDIIGYIKMLNMFMPEATKIDSLEVEVKISAYANGIGYISEVGNHDSIEMEKLFKISRIGREYFIVDPVTGLIINKISKFTLSKMLGDLNHVTIDVAKKPDDHIQIQNYLIPGMKITNDCEVVKEKEYKIYFAFSEPDYKDFGSQLVQYVAEMCYIYGYYTGTISTK